MDRLPQGCLLVADRLFASVALFERLKQRKLSLLVRLNDNLIIKKLSLISSRKAKGARIEEWLVEVGGGSTAPKQTLRYISWRHQRQKRQLLTNVLDPSELSAEDALALYPLRWSVERLFYDLKEVLNLHRFYAANPNAVAMQVYAAAIVHVAMRVAQTRVARAARVVPEAISTSKFFVRLAVASSTLVGYRLGCQAVFDLNPKQRLAEPSPRGEKFVTTTLGAIIIEKRNPLRRKRRPPKNIHRWLTFKRIRGGRRFLRPLT